MNTITQYPSKLIALSSFVILATCIDGISFIKASQAQNSIEAMKSSNNHYTFDFTPKVTRIVEDVPDMNVGNKKAIVNAALILSRNNTEFAAYALAIAMSETRVLTGNTGGPGDNSEYPWRDSKSPSNGFSGPYKDGDASNFGIYKMNWYMIRHSNTMKANNNGKVIGPFAYGAYKDKNGWGQKINTNIGLATRILYDYWSTIKTRPHGTSANGNSSANKNVGRAHNFWGGHRFGQTGWNDGNSNFYGGNQARNTYGWQNTIDYWYAVQSVNNEIDGQLRNFKRSKRRVAYLIHNI
jgi:hypothetical protein